MKKWEYLRILIVPDENNSFGLTSVLVNGEDILDEPLALNSQVELQRYLYRLFNRLGDHGWEMVTAREGLYHFKRLKNEG